jgi:hypothetical protein
MNHSKLKVVAIRSFLSLAAFVGIAQAAASDVSNAKIVQIRVTNGDDAIVTFNKDGTEPSCATFDNGRSLGVDLTTNTGREQLKIATAGYLAGKTFRFIGKGTCVVQSNKEDLQDIFMAD